ncbi:MAG: aldo/keto reductase [Firmicutes bacterium]|uniref:Aldo/keto reductase n=1 Tax=Candidatus Onthovivens merdipullorum TaxID=2840889 RepID=A0A9D9DIX1_9BACL|nr:aldo/keto reductase [Candidatus Onthovivens merdipullorum]
MYDFSFEHIVSCVEQSLSRLNIDYIDVFLLHRPDILCDFEELKSALTYSKENNLVKQFGVCNMNKAYIELFNKKTGFNFVINQLEFSITSTQLIDDILNMNTNDDLANDKSGEALIYCHLNNISLQAWSFLKISLSEGIL